MGKILPADMALGLIRAGKARAEGLVCNTQTPGAVRTYMAITRFDTQATEHYPVGAGDLRDTTAGAEAERAAGMRVA